MIKRQSHARTPKSLGYIRAVTANEYHLLHAAAVFSRHTSAQNLIDDFVTRVKRRTVEILELYRDQNVELRRMVDRAIQEEIAVVLTTIESGANKRFGSEDEPERQEIHTDAT